MRKIEVPIAITLVMPLHSPVNPLLDEYATRTRV